MSSMQQNLTSKIFEYFVSFEGFSIYLNILLNSENDIKLGMLCKENNKCACCRSREVT